MSSFFHELKRRNVYKVAAAYAAMAWLVIQLASILFPTFEAPGWAMKVCIVLVALGFPVALVFAWAFELTPEGIRRAENIAPGPPPRTRRLFVALVATTVIAAGALFLLQRSGWQPAASASHDQPADKSIAVLPFANLSSDTDNAWFADAIQDEILTRLAKVADLKVISRTSTQRYKTAPENLREVAQQLGAAHVLEGSVQKIGDRVRIHVQLIRAESDSHLWAETYDRQLTDIFAVQSDVAATVVKRLSARITGTEDEAVRARPTENLEAYEAYLRGLALANQVSASAEDYHRTILYFARAVQLDPNFAVAWARLAVAHIAIYTELDQTPQQLAEAKRALDSAVSLQPGAGETHFARGMYLYRGVRDYPGALDAFAEARRRLPNQVEAIEYTSYVERRRGRWEEAIALQDQALRLDPRNTILLSETALTYRAVRRIDEARALLDRALTLEPDSPRLLLQKAETYHAQGSLIDAGKLLARIDLSGQGIVFAGVPVRHAIFLRDYPKAMDLLRQALAAEEFLPKSWRAGFRVWLGIAHSLAGESGAAQSTLNEARAELEALRAAGDAAPRIATYLLLAASFLGDAAAVEREAEILQPEIEADAVNGPDRAQAVAMGRARLGKRDRALELLARLLQTPGEASLTPGLLRIDPIWDPMRDDPRFEKLAR